MNSMELPLVVFTVASQLAIGLAVISAVRQWSAATGPAGNVRAEWFFALAALAVGLVGSLFHLGHPAGALNALSNLGSAWLSSEALGMGVVLALIALTAFSARGRANNLLLAFTTLAGLLTLLFTGLTYAPPSFPAVNNALPFAFFLLTAATLGSAFASYFSPEEKKPLVARILMVSLVVSLAVTLLAPCVWLSGSEVMAATGKAWAGSGLYWLRVVGGLILPLAVLATLRRVPAWLPVWLLAGEVLGRVVCFSLTLHTASNLGNLY